ncbi:unnamed protein product [Angiostrongylus costaricensis]|uniref:Reverse transcriptase domain-containing protein n=1 Tax=Angiostrongylus costaricensis TaxID=334426 RepID=A0A0R3PL71_ANGCS|nr:unnamed protein product [Angiostrongylus costaricensis]
MFANEALKVLNHYRAKRYSSNLTPVQKRGMREGGEFVVIPHQLDVEITKKHLEDASLHRPSSEKEFKSKYRKLNHEWAKMERAAGLKPSVISQLKVDFLTCPVLYLLIKTHKWSGKYYAQIRGLAMGQRLAPSLAIAFMSKVEAPVTDLGPLLYCRYVDDCFVLCSTQEEMDKCFELLNAQSEYIKFTPEKPKEKWLPFLNLQIHLSENGYVTKWY